MRSINIDEEVDFNEKQKRNIAILDILRRFAPISRADISQRLGVNVVTVSHYINELVRSNLVLEKELDISEGGRRPGLLDLNSHAVFNIGVGLNLTNMVGLLVDLKGNIVSKTQIAPPGPSVIQVIEGLLGIIRETIRRSKDYTSSIKGIGVGIAGIVDKKTGSIRWPERVNRGHTNYVSISSQLRERIEKEFGLPAIIENDATAACFGEYWFGLEPDLKNILYMFSGVGCGIMINGQIYTGSHGCAGEPSINNPKEDKLFNCSLGNPCFLKLWETDLGIIDNMKSMLAKDKEGAEKFFKLTSSNIENVDLKSVFIAARVKDPLACSALNLAARRLGIRIAYLVNLFNPEAVVIGGGFEETGEEFLNKVSSTIKDWAFREATEDLKIFYSQLRENAVALGAASLVTQKVFSGLL
ncbi:MAG: ROK family transcriptional regulator [Candidatus Omnitrophica bacterium]|nr:ROK family transcriptional regulator [Candidatus Omnitrophota bacterium]